MKKTLTNSFLVLAIVMLWALPGCKKEGPGPDPDPTPVSTATCIDRDAGPVPICHDATGAQVPCPTDPSGLPACASPTNPPDPTDTTCIVHVPQGTPGGDICKEAETGKVVPCPADTSALQVCP
jgi:hypothetical protein